MRRLIGIQYGLLRFHSIKIPSYRFLNLWQTAARNVIANFVTSIKNYNP